MVLRCRELAVWARNRNQGHSMTSLARSRIDGGKARPSTFADLRLTTISNLVGCSTGRSPGFFPQPTARLDPSPARVKNRFAAAPRVRLRIPTRRRSAGGARQKSFPLHAIASSAANFEVTTPSQPIAANTTGVAWLRIAYFAADSMRAVVQCWAAALLPMNWASASAASDAAALAVTATS
jgi:hypothetical protein